MAIHQTIKPTQQETTLRLARQALDTARSLHTHHTGSAYYAIDDTHGVLIGGMANDGIADFTPANEEQHPLWEGLTQADLDKAAQDILATANTSITTQINTVNTTIAAAQQQIDANKSGLEAQAKISSANQAKADANAKAIEAASQDLAKYQAAADKTMDALNSTVTEHGRVLKSAQDDIAQAKNDLAAQAAKLTETATTADSKNRVFMQPTDPAADAATKATLAPGDLWWQTDDRLETYWEGAANNSISVLVDHSDEIQHMWVWNGAGWASHTLYAQDLLVNGSVVTDLLAANAVTAEKIKAGAVTADAIAATALYGKLIVGGTIQTTNGNLTVNDTGILLKSGGKTTVSMLAGDGSATFRQANIIDGTLSAPTIDAGTIKGAEIILLDANKKEWGKANTSGVTLGNGDLTYTPSTGLALKGSIKAGSDISGATITGGIIQTDAAANTGIKVTTGGLVAYGKNSSGTPEAKTTVEAATGRIIAKEMTVIDGSLTAPTITGGTITGAVFQTSAPGTNPRAQFDSTALRMYNGDGAQTVYLDGTGSSNLLTGTFQTRVSGERILLNPDYKTGVIDGSDTYTGQGIVFVNPNVALSPQIGALSKSSATGTIAELDIHSGYLTKGGPGAFQRLMSGTNKATGKQEGAVYLTCNTEYSTSSTTDSGSNVDLYCRAGYGAQAGLNSWSPFATTIATTHARGAKAVAEIRASSLDEKDSIGVQADYAAKRLYFGGRLGGWGNGKNTFQRQRTYSTDSVGGNGSFTWNITWGSPVESGKIYPIGTAESTQVLAITYRDTTASSCKVLVKNTSSSSASPIIINTLGIWDN